MQPESSEISVEKMEDLYFMFQSTNTLVYHSPSKGTKQPESVNISR